jgi:hypothetical protein
MTQFAGIVKGNWLWWSWRMIFVGVNSYAMQ